MKHILLIDDNDLFRDYLAAGLRDNGYGVDAYGNGMQGMKSFEIKIPDVVVTDLVMDDGEGIETILEIRKNTKTIPIVAISGHAEYLGNSAKLGADRTLLKPFRLTQLIACFEQLI